MTQALTAPLAAVSLAILSGPATSTGDRRASAAGFDDPPIHVVADLSARRLSIYEGNTLVDSDPVAVGIGSKPTPRGNYTMRKIVWNPAWVPPDEEASHGCLRMDPDDAYRVARYLMEHGGEPRDESWFWRVLHFRSETRTVYLSNPIAMAVTD